MTKKIFAGVTGVSLIIMLICAGLTMGIVYDYMGKKIDEQLVDQALLVEEGRYAGGQAFLDILEAAESLESRVTVISAEGEVLYDSAANSTTMENHMAREEVKEALAFGEGFAKRISYTLAEDMRYYARKTRNGDIIRLSTGNSSQMRLLMDTFGMLIVTVTILLVLGAIISYRVAKAIVKPINLIDLDEPDVTKSYEELKPLLHRIHQQNTNIGIQMEKLRQNREEFNIITENMNEGLIVIGPKGQILSANASAAVLLGVDRNQENIQKTEVSVLSLNTSAEFANAVNEALKGKGSQIYIESRGVICEVITSPVKENKQVQGAILILLDVTQKQQVEKLRREFTSNVSHELKTPLTSIYGISDMLTSGLVKSEDVNGFARTIKDEAARLIRLIDDIIKLSRLDEGVSPEEQEILDLWAIAEDVRDRLSAKAMKQEVSLKCSGVSTFIKGTAHIVDEIIYNLCENGIKYNRQGGSVEILVKAEGDKSVLLVKDTGIGISSVEQERIFERFYRVDKSHSKKIEGTGLGLSIVKHGVAYLNGAISLESEEGKGTTVRVEFPIYHC